MCLDRRDVVLIKRVDHQRLGGSSRFLILAIALATALNIVACEGDSGKGAEDDMDPDGKLDSFYSPTLHGTLPFGEVQEVVVTAEELYHAWDFELSEPASIAIETTLPEGGLEDTVLYLYQWSDERDSWGSYIARDDDGGQGEASLLRAVVEAGTFRLMAKGYRRSMLGVFTLLATCDGPGCEQCVDLAQRPQQTGYGSACNEPLHALLGSIGARQSIHDGVQFEDRCELTDLERHAVEYVFGDFGEDLDDTLSVSTDVVGETGLSVVTVITEDIWTVSTLLFDGDELVVLHSDDGMGGVAEWFCSGPSGREPEPWCAADYFVASITTAATEIETGSGSSENVDLLPPTATFALDYYRQAHDLAEDVVVQLEWEQWELSLYTARVTLSADGQPTVTYFTNECLLMARVDESLEFICINPD